MNWEARIAAAKQSGAFTGDDVEAAFDWRSSPCAEAGSTINSQGPTDAILHLAGWAFADSVQHDDAGCAANWLEVIQHRAKWLVDNPPKVWGPNRQYRK